MARSKQAGTGEPGAAPRRRRQHVAATLALAAIAALTGCAGGAGGRVEPQALGAEIEAGTAPVVLDVRSSREYRSGHLPGATHLPFQSTWTRRDELPASLDAPIVVYCEHGPRAALARFGLESLGYRDVRMLDGHMSRWREDGRPLERGEAP